MANFLLFEMYIIKVQLSGRDNYDQTQLILSMDKQE